MGPIALTRNMMGSPWCSIGKIRKQGPGIDAIKTIVPT